MNISVVIPNYNGVHLFPSTLPALVKALEHSKRKYEIIVVDDCSTDNSVAHLKEFYAEITILENKTNSGFATTTNKGIFAAKFELVLLLNSDVKLTEDYFTSQFRYFDYEDTFGVMGKIVGWDDDNIQDGAKYPALEGCKLKTSLNYLPVAEKGSFSYSMYLSGANALIDRKKLLSLGGFNELFSPFYMEDVDLSVRAWRVGWKCYFETSAICRHKTSSSISSKEKKTFVRTIYNRNKMMFHAIHFDRLMLAGWWIQICIELIFRGLTFRFDYIISFISFLQSYKAIQNRKNAFNKVLASMKSNKSLVDIVRLIQKSAGMNKKSVFKSRA